MPRERPLHILLKFERVHERQKENMDKWVKLLAVKFRYEYLSISKGVPRISICQDKAPIWISQPCSQMSPTSSL